MNFGLLIFVVFSAIVLSFVGTYIITSLIILSFPQLNVRGYYLFWLIFAVLFFARFNLKYEESRSS